MNFILNILNMLSNTLFGKFGNTKTNSNNNTYKIETSNKNNAMNDARASVIWVCVVVVAIYWIPQYLFADFMWIKACLAHNAIVPFPLNDKKLFDLLYSILGLGVVGAIHKFISK